MDDRPLILTARFDAELFGRLDRLRKAHFPPAINCLSAHLTLFHALPGAELESVRRDLAENQPIEPLACVVSKEVFTGRGVHLSVECEPLRSIRETLAKRWGGWLTKQDQQSFRPHVTVQNKVDPAEARRLFEQFSRTWSPLSGRIVGLDLWHYAGGPWEHVSG